MNKTAARPARFLLQMRDDLREAIQTAAEANGRTLTAEINTRLRDSLTPKHGPTLTAILEREKAAKGLPASYTAGHTHHIGNTNDNGPANAHTDIDRAMLDVFHTLPPERQHALLALLSLFR